VGPGGGSGVGPGVRGSGGPRGLVPEYGIVVAHKTPWSFRLAQVMCSAATSSEEYQCLEHLVAQAKVSGSVQ
jgi:hypothetical protein